MSKLSEMDATIKELRDIAASINDIANWLTGAFSTDTEPETDAAPAPTTKEPEPVLAFEDVRAILADKSREGFTAQIRDLLSSIFSAITSGEKKEKKEETTQLSEQRRSVTCSTCGTTLADFMKNGHLGCPDCYSAFREEIQPMLQQMHGRLQHVGRRPLHSEDAQRSRTLQEDLTRKMEQAVSLEDFETAAKIRDQLKALSSKEGQL